MTSSQLNVSETPPMSQEDLETLAKNETDENGLILGKFKTVEDLAASYKELEGKLGSTDTSEEEEGEEVTEENESETDYHQIYGDGLAEVLDEVGIDPEDITNRFIENGNISDDDYTKLAEGGFSRQVIDTYLDGVRSQGNVEEIARGEISNIKEIAGGDQGYEQMKSWANENLSQDEITAFDNLTATASAPAIRLAVQGLYSLNTVMLWVSNQI